MTKNGKYMVPRLGIGNSGRDKGYELGLGIRVSFHANDSLFMSQLEDRILSALTLTLTQLDFRKFVKIFNCVGCANMRGRLLAKIDLQASLDSTNNLK